VVFTRMQVFFSNFFAGVFQPWMGADFLEGKTGCDLFCGNLPAGLSCEVPPSGRGVWVFLVRRYVSLRETHPRLCTFASPRRVPSGHGDPLCTQKLWARKNLRARKTDWHGDLRARIPVGNSPGHESCFKDNFI
jgi:hypothetical protein